MVNNSSQQPLSIIKFVRLVLKRWYVILASLLLALSLAWAYNRYTVPQYRVVASLMVKDGDGNSYADFIFGSKNRNELNLNNEAAILKSFGYVAATVASMDLNITYYREGKVTTTEIYPDAPIKVEIDYPKSKNPPMGKMFAVKADGPDGFQLSFPETSDFKGKYEEWYDIDGLYFRIIKNHELPEEDRILFRLNSLQSLTQEYSNKLRIYPQSASSSVLEISVVGENRAKEMDFLNKFLTMAERLNLTEKNYNFKKALEFLDEQIDINTDSLQNFENLILGFQDQNNTVSIEAETSQLYEEVQALESQRSQILINDRYYDYLLRTLREGSQYDKITIPASIGVDDPTLAELVSRLISSQMEVKALLEDNKTKNPLVASKQKEINELKTHILSTVENLRGAKQITLDELNSRLRENRVALSKLPKAQQELGGIQRNYGINENLYMLLMNKKLETGIQLAANLSDYKKVNDAQVAGGPVSPNYLQNYLFAGVGGLAIPLAILYLLVMLNSKVIAKEEVSEVLPYIVAASIPENEEKNTDASQINPNSAVAEAFRALRSNLSYLKPDSPKGQVIMFSSGLSGEGKTFCSQHLAYVLALSDKRVMLINCDMRKPYQSSEQLQKGLSDYLAGMATFKEVVKSTNLPGLKLINAGKQPPNPAELLLNYRMESLLLDLKQDEYDYIILDTAPIGLFADSLSMMRHADLLLLVARHNYTPLKALKQVKELLTGVPKDKLALIYNGVVGKKTLYGNSKYYQSYYGKDKKKKSRSKIK